MASKKKKSPRKAVAKKTRTASAISRRNREKGAEFERQLGHLFAQHLKTHHGVVCEFKRHIGQSRDGGTDLPVGRFMVEAKRRQKLGINRRWIAQARAAADARFAADPNILATRLDHVPVVVMKEDGPREPIVMLELADFLHLVGGHLVNDLARAEAGA